MRRRPDPHTRDLFAAPEPVAIGFGDDVTGRGSVTSQIAKVVSRTLCDARDDEGLSRKQVAKLISGRLDREISEHTLDKYASEGAENRVIPLDVFVALIAVTKGYEALGFIPNLFGYAVVEERYVEIIEMKQIDDHTSLLQARKEALIAKARARR